jgi:hypothetical protein
MIAPSALQHGYGLQEPQLGPRQGQERFLSTKTSRIAAASYSVGTGILSWDKVAGSEFEKSPPYRTDIREKVKICLYYPSTYNA